MRWAATNPKLGEYVVRFAWTVVLVEDTWVWLERYEQLVVSMMPGTTDPTKPYRRLLESA